MDVPEESLVWLLGHARTGDPEIDALHAARVSRHIRELNTEHGGAVLAFLQHLPAGPGKKKWSLRDLARAIGTSKDSISRWADPPPSAPAEPDDG